MKIIKIIIKRFCIIFDLLIFPFCLLAGIIFKIYRNLGVSDLGLTTKLLRWLEIFPIRNHYYEPQFIHDNVNFNKKKNIKINLDNANKLIKKFKFSHELKKMSLEKKKSKFGFLINNGFFGRGDFEFLYQFIRLSNPKKIIEIGSGYSSIIAYEAITKNFETKKKSCKMICIDPGNINQLKILKKIKFYKKKIEEVNINIFKELNKNDLLIIDTTHVIKPSGDVLKIYNEIMPILKKGVNIMIHDIYLPYEYPKDLLNKQVLFWNEQYLLENLLNSKSYKILSPLYYLMKNNYKQLKEVCSYLKFSSRPCSFYIKKINKN
jgi:predicted O-methyltransferase YrrM